MRITPCESTPRSLAHTSTSATVPASAAFIPVAEKMAVANSKSSLWLTRTSLIKTPPRLGYDLLNERGCQSLLNGHRNCGEMRRRATSIVASSAEYNRSDGKRNFHHWLIGDP